MDQVYIDALVNQAIGAYKAGGDEGLEQWKKALPAPHLAEFEKYCAEPLRKAIDEVARRGQALGPVEPAEELEPGEAKQPPATDPRQRHRRDRRRTKPL